MGSTELVRQMGADAIWRVLDRARRRWRGVLAMEGMLKALAFALVGLALCFIADNVLHLGGTTRFALGLAVLLVAVVMLVRRTLWPLLMPVTDEMTAVHVERSLPSLDNKLINAVQFSEELHGYDPIAQDMALRQIEETIQTVHTIPITHTTDMKPLRKWAWRAGICVAAVVVYGTVWGEYIRNAFVRYSSPFAYHPPITRTKLSVGPGNAEILEGERLLIEARATGDVPDKAEIVYWLEGESRKTKRPMPFQGDRFVFVFESVQKPFFYSVAAGDAVSPDYAVVVRRRPRISRLNVSLHYPAYMGIPKQTEEKANGNIVAPIGTDARIEVVADRPLKRAWAEFEWIVIRQDEAASEKQTVKFTLRGEDTAVADIHIDRSGQYRIFLEDQGLVRNEPVVCQVIAQPDNAPYVTVTSPGKNVAVSPGQKIVILAKAQDDFGVRDMEFFLQRGEKDGYKPIQKWTYGPQKKTVNEAATIDLATLKSAPGDVLLYYWRAGDGLSRKEPDAGRGPVYQISVISARAANEKVAEDEKRLRDALRRLIALQKDNLTGTARVSHWAGSEAQDMASEPAVKRRFALMVDPLVKQETDIYTQIAKTVTEMKSSEKSVFLTELNSIASTEVTEAVRALKLVQGATRNKDAVDLSKGAIASQDKVLKKLQRLLDRLEMAEKLAENKSNMDEEKLSQDEQEETARDKVKALLRKLENFKDEQKEVIKLSNRLAEKDADDFTKDDKLDHENITKTQEKWSKIFKEAATDLSKLPEQDFSLATQAKELVEMFTELQKKLDDAAEKSKKNVEIAVPVEQAGLELAKSIESNLERWLAEDKDSIKWSMEEPTSQNEVPLADLPEELEDITGDLLDKEDEMTDDVEDVTSGWMDSMDKGAGWDAMDGPISNMSAKGVTGNRLPNDMEIGGRSGEGRSGKSSGQFVEEEARGKGGRATPTRMTADPFEAGKVKDTSPEPASGSTGGGKMSGEGEEGLRGPVPPPIKGKLQRMAHMQQQLIQKAERLDHGLEKQKYAKGKLPETIEMMRDFKQAADRGEYKNYSKMHKVILSNLREVKDVVAQQKKLNRDRSAKIPKEVRDEITSSLKEKAPKEYRDLVEEYFKSLSKTE